MTTLRRKLREWDLNPRGLLTPPVFETGAISRTLPPLNSGRLISVLLRQKGIDPYQLRGDLLLPSDIRAPSTKIIACPCNSDCSVALRPKAVTGI